MTTVQITIADYLYAEQLRDLLVRDGTHRVYLVDTPNPKIDGVIVVDDRRPKDVPCSERYVIVANKAPLRISSLFHADVRHLVFATDPPSTACLAILAAELRLAQNNRLLNA